MPFCISLNPNQFTSYYKADKEPLRNPSYSFARDLEQKMRSKSLQNLKLKRAGSGLSVSAQRRLKKAINWLTFLSAKRLEHTPEGRQVPNFQVSFITLTLPAKQHHSHAEIKSRCLNHFFNLMRQHFVMRNYIWKAEIQKNGNIHFHITTDKFIPYMAIRKYWNASLELLGYVSDYQHKFRNLTLEQYAARSGHSGGRDPKKIKRAWNYGNSTNWRSPNSTDVHSVKNVKDLAAYMAKYMAKGLTKKNASRAEKESAKSYQGRIWFCSQSLSKLGNVHLFFDKFSSKILNYLQHSRRVFSYITDWSSTFFLNFKQLPRGIVEWVRQELVSHAIEVGYPLPAAIPTF